jgi:geranylgeranylglycerol-phosphate geranylgeranyltransferase
VHPVLRLVRLGNTVVAFAGTLVGGLVARGMGLAFGGSFGIALALAALSSALVAAGGNVLNDIGDQASDRRNHPDRPLVTGAVSVASARRLATGCFVASGLLVVPIAFAAVWIVPIWALAVGALLAYEFRFKSRGLPGNALVAFLTAALFLYGGAVAGRPLVLLPFVLMAFGATLSREIIKDMEDAEGDTDRRTLPRTHGIGTATAGARLAVVLAVALSPIPILTLAPLTSAVGIIYLALVGVADALFVWSVAWLPRDLHRAQSVSKGAMSVALVAFLAVAFR